jgi:hypothetical protein
MDNILNQLNEIISLLKESGLSNYIAIFSLIVSAIALLANILTNIRNNKQYIESLKPLLSFDFFEMNGALLLSVKNVGKSEAKNIKLEILKINNNGDNNNLILDGLFENEFMLYPEEAVQGIVGYSGDSIEEKTFPIIDIQISFVNGNDNKKNSYGRTIAFKKNIYSRNALSKIEDSLVSISYSNNRMANYIEGRTLFRFDELNVFPNNSLYKDMKDAFNNIEREKKKVNKKTKK